MATYNSIYSSNNSSLTSNSSNSIYGIEPIMYDDNFGIWYEKINSTIISYDKLMGFTLTANKDTEDITVKGSVPDNIYTVPNIATKVKSANDRGLITTNPIKVTSLNTFGSSGDSVGEYTVNNTTSDVVLAYKFSAGDVRQLVISSGVVTINNINSKGEVTSSSTLVSTDDESLLTQEKADKRYIQSSKANQTISGNLTVKGSISASNFSTGTVNYTSSGITNNGKTVISYGTTNVFSGNATGLTGDALANRTDKSIVLPLPIETAKHPMTNPNLLGVIEVTSQTKNKIITTDILNDVLEYTQDTFIPIIGGNVYGDVYFKSGVKPDGNGKSTPGGLHFSDSTSIMTDENPLLIYTERGTETRTTDSVLTNKFFVNSCGDTESSICINFKGYVAQSDDNNTNEAEKTEHKDEQLGSIQLNTDGVNVGLIFDEGTEPNKSIQIGKISDTDYGIVPESKKMNLGTSMNPFGVVYANKFITVNETTKKNVQKRTDSIDEYEKTIEALKDEIAKLNERISVYEQEMVDRAILIQSLNDRVSTVESNAYYDKRFDDVVNRLVILEKEIKAMKK